MNHVMSVVERLAFAEAEFKKFRIELPHLTAAEVRLDAMRASIQHTRGQEQNPLFLIGPSHSGKSTIIKHWCERIAASEPQQGSSPSILHVTLSTSSTVKSLGADILVALGHLAPPMEVIEDTARRRGRVRRRSIDPSASDFWLLILAMRSVGLAGVDVLVLDELHHLVQSDKAVVTRYSVTEAIKKICIEGVCQVVGVGTERLGAILCADNSKQLANRAQTPIVLRPLDIAISKNAKLFKQWVGAVDEKLVEHGIFPEKCGLARQEWLSSFYDVSRGIIGRVSRLVAEATNHAIINGRHKLAADDLSYATRNWAMFYKLADWDPWKEKQGPRDLKVIKGFADKEFPL